MKSKQLGIGKGFRVALGTCRSQVAETRVRDPLPPHALASCEPHGIRCR